MNFSIGYVATLLVKALRLFFTEVGGTVNLTWDSTPSKRTLDIRETYDAATEGVQELPRVLVSRGQVTVNKTGLNDNFASETSFKDRKGDVDLTRLAIFSGSATILVEAATKGSCEMIADMVTHFFAWCWPELCATYGWKVLGMPLTVGECTVTTQETPNVSKFSIQIDIPWMVEERWSVKTLSPLLKKVNLLVEQNP